ncbi:MAG: chromosome segregation protein SMC [Deltaproteobacteria bacterium]|nr:chromosome segregation protein SMC [Deltaproteobacteria bacterium]
MKLKKLELFGFKSFYDKTIFEFSEGITAIVGPNGCGKSNIVDAIRWVLGEHAPTYLRSKALEDVIFAGSDAAGPLGMAEVSLTFGNEEGGGPPGYESYAEIQVTRRTFRNGESEFYINRVPCRLKDIAELFLDTGAGARGYAIIEQGRISTIVNAKPDEKRLIVEEAAGVAKFRVRKKEAERKMESTRQNLARVKDILDEVKRQIGSLDRQVRKAEKYKALKEELRDLDLRIAARKFREFTQLRSSAGVELHSLEDSLLGIRGEISRLEAEMESMKIRHAEAESEERDLGAAHGALKEEVARREEEWKGNVRQAGELRGLIDEAAARAEVIGQEISALAVRIGDAREGASLRRESVDSARGRFAALSAEAGGAEEEYRLHRELSDRAKYDLMVRVNHHSTALSSAGSYQRTIDDNERKLVRLEEQVGAALAESGKAERELAEVRAREDVSRDAVAGAETSWEETGRLLDESTVRIDDAVKTRAEAEGLLQASSSRLDTLSRVYEQKDWATSGVRAVLRHFNGHGKSGGAEGDKGIFGVIGDLVETDAPYEKAVEAVLGERMQSIVVRDHTEGLSALRFLKETREGRGTFVPVSLRSREDAPAYLGEEGVIAPLADVVRASSECGDLVRGLLGGALLVRDMDCALRLWNRNGVWNTYVTLEGDVVTAEGALVGGSLGESESGILAVKREMRDLEKEIAVIACEAARLREAEEESRRTKAELEERRNLMFRRREECTNELRRVEQLRAGLEAARSQAVERHEDLVRDLEYQKADLARIRTEHKASQEAAQLSGQAKGEEEERVRRLIEALEEKRLSAEDARKRCHAAEIELAELAGKDDAERKALEGLEAALEEKRVLAGDWSRRKTDYAGRVRALEEAIESGRTAVEEGAAELSRRQEAIDRLIDEKAAIAAKIDSLGGSMKETRRGAQEASDRLTDLRLSVQRIENDLSNLDVLTYQRYEAHPADLPVPEEAADPEGEAAEISGWESRAAELRDRISGMGDVNLASIEEYREQTERHSFLAGEKEDLEKSLDDLSRAIQRINRTTRERFSDTFGKINEKLTEVFPRLFLGGRAFLTLIDEENLLETGVELVVQLPGKKLLPLSSLSGGEKSLAAACLIFSIFLVKPSPFCLLDEADAALDDANIDRFNSLVREMSGRYQFLLITHNKRTMELADSLYGITMEKPGISKVVSVKFNA